MTMLFIFVPEIMVWYAASQWQCAEELYDVHFCEWILEYVAFPLQYHSQLTFSGH